MVHIYLDLYFFPSNLSYMLLMFNLLYALLYWLYYFVKARRDVTNIVGSVICCVTSYCTHKIIKHIEEGGTLSIFCKIKKLRYTLYIIHLF